ncbi:hypothetical protein Tco_1140421 [Tanacetum coccineum]
MKDEENILFQKAKIKWLRVGGRNNAYFHKVIKSINHKSRINVVRDVDEVFSSWMAFRGNTRDLDSSGEETDKTMDLHQISSRIMHTGRGDGVTSIKRRRCYLSSDGVRKLTTASRRNQLKSDLEDSIL